MPYEYRKLSPKKRKELVQERIRRGYPLHQPPHPFRESGTYLITAANYEHARIIDSPERRTEFQDILLEGFQEIRATIISWVIIPNHYHILVNVSGLEHVSNLLKQIHGSTSYKWNKQDGLTGKRKIWCRYTDRKMRNETHIKNAINYIHYNPVKHGLVRDEFDWPWSSIFMSDEGRQLSR